MQYILFFPVQWNVLMTWYIILYQIFTFFMNFKVQLFDKRHVLSYDIFFYMTAVKLIFPYSMF